MSMFGIKVNGVNNLQMTFKKFSKATPQVIRREFYAIGKDLVKDMKGYIGEGKSGRTYMTKKGVSKFKKSGVTASILNKSRAHVASAPGEAPANWTGRLRESLNFEVVGATEQSLRFGVDEKRVRGGCPYAKYLEYKDLVGMTGNGSKRIAPRPFVSRAFKENKNKIISRVEAAIKQSLHK